MDFLPENQFGEREIPFFEDATMSGAWGNLSKSIAGYQADVTKALGRAGGLVTAIIPGMFPGQPPRYGFRISFAVGSVAGRVDVAAPPIRRETASKKENALKQALYLFWKELDAAADAWAYKPNSMPLLPYLLGPGGKTVTEELVARGILPEVGPVGYLPAPNGKQERT